MERTEQENMNDQMVQKKLGVFYTPEPYCSLGKDLLEKAIKCVPDGFDYVICDVCAGTGNLEAVLNDEQLSHVIVNTYELKEWSVLRNRLGHKVRALMPPQPDACDRLPKLNQDGFLAGANALSEEFTHKLNNVIEQTKKADQVIRIWYMNPPYAETTSVEFQKKGAGKESTSWKNEYVVQEMKKHIPGAASNDMGNAFIWAAFHIFKADYCIVYFPVKYWKAQHLIDRKFIDGYALNRKHFHTDNPACVMLALWKNEADPCTKQITLKAYDIDEKMDLVPEGDIVVKQVNTLFSEVYYDNRKFDDDTYDGIASNFDGTETIENTKKIRVPRTYNANILAYMAIDAAGFDNPRLHACMMRTEKYNGNGFNVRSDNFLEKLPLFAASRYTDNYNDWKIMSMLMKSGDQSEKYFADIKSGKLDQLLCQCLIWTCMTHYSHIRSLNGSDGRLYRNELCFDDLDNKTTIARQKLNEFIANGYELSDEEKSLFEKWNVILSRVHEADEYNPIFTYGLYQIDQEINVKVPQEVKGNSKHRLVKKYEGLNNLIKELKKILRSYYLNNLVGPMFKYELLK